LWNVNQSLFVGFTRLPLQTVVHDIAPTK
jgi:hypothetical protein